MKKIESPRELTEEEEKKAEEQLELYDKFREKHDLPTAITHLKAAVDLNYLGAYPSLFIEFKDGNIDWIPEEKIISLLNQSADDSDSRAEVLLGLYYTYDKNDEIKGTDYFHRSAFHGNAMGMYRLSEHYFSKGDIVAMDYLYKAAELGDTTAIVEVAKVEKELKMDDEDDNN